MRNLISIFFLFLLFFSKISFAEQIISSIKPINEIVKSITKSKRNILLIDNNQSPHHFKLKISDRKKIEKAKIIFYISDKFEVDLGKSLQENKNIKKIQLIKDKNIDLIKLSDSKRKNNIDYHIWLDPNNLIAMAENITRQLIKINPKLKTKYQKNLKKYKIKIKKLDQKIRKRFAKKKPKKYLVYHDAYKYFERAYNIKASGIILGDHNKKLKIRDIKRLRAKIKQEKIGYIFTEPQFDDSIVGVLIGGGGEDVKVKIINPLNGLKEYFRVLSQL
jgi:zinc transport system substrate-binding protein